MILLECEIPDECELVDVFYPDKIMTFQKDSIILKDLALNMQLGIIPELNMKSTTKPHSFRCETISEGGQISYSYVCRDCQLSISRQMHDEYLRVIKNEL